MTSLDAHVNGSTAARTIGQVLIEAEPNPANELRAPFDAKTREAVSFTMISLTLNASDVPNNAVGLDQ